MNKYNVRIVDLVENINLFPEAKDVTIIHDDVFITDTEGKEHKFLMDMISEISIKVSFD